METISWSSGEKSEKSFKKDKPILNDKANIIDNLRNSGKYIIRKDNRSDEQKNNVNPVNSVNCDYSDYEDIKRKCYMNLKN